MNWPDIIQQFGFPTAWSLALAYALWKLASCTGRRLFSADGYVTRLVDSTVRTQTSLAESHEKMSESIEAIRLMICEDISARQERDERLMKLLRRRGQVRRPAAGDVT